MAPLLSKILQSGDYIQQSAAADTAAALGLKQLVPDLAKALQTSPPMAHRSLTTALALLGDREAASRLRADLASPAFSVRLSAAAALRKMGDDASWIDAVRHGLGEGTLVERVEVAGLMLGGERVEALRTLTFASVDPNPVVREEVVRVLAADPKGDRPYLRAFLNDGSARVRLLAARKLAQITMPASQTAAK